MVAVLTSKPALLSVFAAASAFSWRKSASTTCLVALTRRAIAWPIDPAPTTTTTFVMAAIRSCKTRNAFESDRLKTRHAFKRVTHLIERQLPRAQTCRFELLAGNQRQQFRVFRLRIAERAGHVQLHASSPAAA